MLADVLDHGGEAVLVPGSGIQFLDFDFVVDPTIWPRYFAVAEKWPPDNSGSTPPSESSGMIEVPNIDAKMHSYRPVAVKADQAFSAFLNKWLPLPFLRCSRLVPQQNFANGPLRWCRMWLTALPEERMRYRLTLAIDTGLAESFVDGSYFKPTVADSKKPETRFMFVGKNVHARNFSFTPWMDAILEGFTQSPVMPPNRQTPGGWAAKSDRQVKYLALLSLLEDLKLFPAIVFTNWGAQPIDVDLVLDIGNSRTCGIISEIPREPTAHLSDCYKLGLRDLTRPHLMHSKPFPSRLEFARTALDPRQESFAWHSVARVGEEADFLSRYQSGSDGITGNSSPKRYLWDCCESKQNWCFNSYPEGPSGGYVITGAFVKYLKRDGERKSDAENGPTTQAKFSRSSLMSFFVAELILQALVQINSWGQRRQAENPGTPRRLRQIVITTPTAMPSPIRKIYRQRAQTAIDVLWAALERSDAPQLHMELDEATGTQIAFLYNEIKRNFASSCETFFDTYGRIREKGNRKTLRIANIDVGGGTTDLAITTFEPSGPASLKLIRDFQEGINVAGDDILARVIEHEVLPALQRALSEAGAKNTQQILSRVLAGRRESSVIRRRFANQVLAPVGLELLCQFERNFSLDKSIPLEVSFRNVLGNDKTSLAPTIDYFAGVMAEMGHSGFSLDDVVIKSSIESIDRIIRELLGKTLHYLCYAVNALDCDFLLLSGQTSRLPTIQLLAADTLAVPADRLVHMKGYPVGDWYPYGDGKHISDPKTVASVGALVSSLSKDRLRDFHLESDWSKSISTVRYLGALEPCRGLIRSSNIIFEVNESGVAYPQNALIGVNPPPFIGYRQFSNESWPSSPLYRLAIEDGCKEKAGKQPTWAELNAGPSIAQTLRITKVTDDKNNEIAGEPVWLVLQTLPDNEGYWFDTGKLAVPPPLQT